MPPPKRNSSAFDALAALQGDAQAPAQGAKGVPQQPVRTGKPVNQDDDSASASGYVGMMVRGQVGPEDQIAPSPQEPFPTSKASRLPTPKLIKPTAKTSSGSASNNLVEVQAAKEINLDNIGVSRPADNRTNEDPEAELAQPDEVEAAQNDPDEVAEAPDAPTETETEYESEADEEAEEIAAEEEYQPEEEVEDEELEEVEEEVPVRRSTRAPARGRESERERPQRRSARAVKVPSWYNAAIPIMFTLSAILLFIGLWAVGAVISIMGKMTGFPLVRWYVDPQTAENSVQFASAFMAYSMIMCLPIAVVLVVMAIIMGQKVKQAEEAQYQD
ncbi:MAG: hypothetical protein WCJ97_02075 [Phycisphaerae bacterium]